MDLVYPISLGIYLVEIVILVVLIGILFFSVSKFKNLKRDLLFFIFISVTMLIALVFAMYFTLIINVNIIFGIISIFFSLLSFILLLNLFVKFQKRLNSKLGFTIIGLYMIGIILTIFKFFYEFIIIVLIVNFLTLTVLIMFNFLTINFIIDKENAIKNNYQKIKKRKFNIKKTVIFWFFGFLIIGFIAGNILIQDNRNDNLIGELVIYNWEDYFAPGIIENFEKEFGINVIEKYFKDEFVLFDKNLSEYDIIIVSDSLLKNMISNEKLYALNKKNIPNLDYIDEKCIMDEFSNYAVPYFWGTTGLIFNTKYIDEETDSWNILWNSKYSGKISVINNYAEVFGMAAKYIGLPLVVTDKFELKKIEDFLFIQKSLLVGYEDDITIMNKLISEELWAAQTYGGTARQAMLENENLKFIIPKEGSSQWVDNFVISKNSKNKYAAEIFINYILSLNININITKYQESYSCNSKTMDILGNEFLKDISYSESISLEYLSGHKEGNEIIEAKNMLWRKLTR